MTSAILNAIAGMKPVASRSAASRRSGRARLRGAKRGAASAGGREKIVHVDELRKLRGELNEQAGGGALIDQAPQTFRAGSPPLGACASFPEHGPAEGSACAGPSTCSAAKAIAAAAAEIAAGESA